MQINVFRNPKCVNYGVPPLPVIPRSRKGIPRDHFLDGYAPNNPEMFVKLLTIFKSYRASIGIGKPNKQIWGAWDV